MHTHYLIKIGSFSSNIQLSLLGMQLPQKGLSAVMTFCGGAQIDLKIWYQTILLTLFEIR